MRLDINKKYCVISTTYEFRLCEKTMIKDKDNENQMVEQLVVVPCGHCDTLQQCFKTLIDNTIRGSKAINDIKMVLDEVREMKESIDKALEGLDVDKITKEYKKYDKVRYDGDKGKDEKESKIEDDESEEE